jgi:very-short-patch-repair endonuclease
MDRDSESDQLEIPEANFVIQMDRDSESDHSTLGWSVLRVADEAVFADLEAVVLRVVEAARQTRLVCGGG